MISHLTPAYRIAIFPALMSLGLLSSCTRSNNQPDVQDSEWKKIVIHYSSSDEYRGEDQDPTYQTIEIEDAESLKLLKKSYESPSYSGMSTSSRTRFGQVDLYLQSGKTWVFEFISDHQVTINSSDRKTVFSVDLKTNDFPYMLLEYVKEIAQDDTAQFFLDRNKPAG